MSSQSSGLTASDLEQEEISNMDLSEKEPMSSDWTDEKHSMFLKSMEASFVDQLYSSMDSSGWLTRNKHNSGMRSFKHTKSHTPDQFKVQQNGSWQSIKFCKGEPPPQECHFLQGNPWIQHYRAGERQDQTTWGNTACGSQKVSSGARMMSTCGLTNIIKHSPVFRAHQDSSVGEEFSDQNFDEENEEGTGGSLHTMKRTKMGESSSSNDQEVPFSRSCCSKLSHPYSSPNRRIGNDWQTS